MVNRARRLCIGLRLQIPQRLRGETYFAAEMRNEQLGTGQGTREGFYVCVAYALRVRRHFPTNNEIRPSALRREVRLDLPEESYGRHRIPSLSSIHAAVGPF